MCSIGLIADINLQVAHRDDAPVLLNLLELYSHDFSEFCSVAIGEDGKFGYKGLDEYWSLPERHPFIIKADGQLAGLALVRRGSPISGDPGVWDMTEFFVLRGYRRRGVGTLAAREVWRRFPGSWQVCIMQSNSIAGLFWQHALPTLMRPPTFRMHLAADGKRWNVISFESG